MDKDVAIIINTFLRDDKLFNLLNSIIQYAPADGYKLYIGDQGIMTPVKYLLYALLTRLGHRIIKVPQNGGLAETRNILVKETQEPYICLMDDDFLITKDFNLEIPKMILQSNPEYGVVGGRLEWFNDYHLNLRILPEGIALHIPIDHSNEVKTPYSHFPCEIVLNFALFKREVFNDIQWDENLKLAEHFDFYLRLKQTQWKVVYTPLFLVRHQSVEDNNTYKFYRTFYNLTDSYQLMLKKHNLKELKVISTKEYIQKKEYYDNLK